MEKILRRYIMEIISNLSGWLVEFQD